MCNNNKSQQYLFEKIAGDQKGQTALHIGSRGESLFLVAASGVVANIYLAERLPFPSLPLEVGPLFEAIGGLGERSSSPSGCGRSPATKRILLHFELKSRHLVATIFVIFLTIN